MPARSAFLVFCALALPTAEGGAKDAAWSRHENPHFIAYSDAPEKKVVPLLRDLETFRAAFLQVGNIPVPGDAPRTTVLILADRKDFRQLARSKLTAGFANHDGKRTLIVLPVQGDRNTVRTIIRHEYGHALLRHMKFPYPKWFEEGFAEIVSSTELVNKGQSFTIGMPPRRAKYNGPPLFDWDTLVSDEFQPHTITNPRLGSSAYAQAWLLAHYTMFGNNMKNSSTLQKYFNAINDGEAQGAAFKSAFGMSAAEMWHEDLQDYAKHIPVYTIAYRPGTLQLTFSTTPVSGKEVDTLRRYLEMRSTINTDAETPNNLLASLPGRWAPFDMDLACDQPADFSVEGTADKGRFSIAPAAPPGAASIEPMHYRYTLADDGLILLEAEGAYHDEPTLLSIRPRSADLLCMGPGHQAGGCAQVLYRCAE